MNIPEHGKYQWLPMLYSMIKYLKPKKIVEFGPGKGLTTITIAMALKDNNIEGKINSYDLWVDEYWGDYENTLEEYRKWEVSDYISLQEKDFYEWLKTDEYFDFLYFDIDNNGDKILDLYEKTKYEIEEGSVIMFVFIIKIYITWNKIIEDKLCIITKMIEHKDYLMYLMYWMDRLMYLMLILQNIL